MLSRSIRALSKSSKINAVKSIASYHQSTPRFKKTAELEVSNTPFDKFAQGVHVIKSTLLNAPPLRGMTRPNIELLPFTGKATNWEQSVKEAQSLVNSADQERIFDPVKLIGKDLWELKGNITQLLGSGHPFIQTIGKHYLEGDTNRIRPLLVLLMAKATCTAPKKSQNQHDFDILPTQRRLAEISEMIYTSSLLHYDVIDSAEQITRPGFGNKLAVLGGDFLLARASLALSQLKNPECIELMATCIANLVEAEFMQLQDPQEKSPDQKKAFEYYLNKIYMQTGSLIAQSCKAASVLGECSNETALIAYDYGKHLGIAMQLIDDLREFSQMAAKIGKLKITTPVLLAWEEFPELGPFIERGFKQEGDAEQARVLIYKSSALKQTLALANQHIESAISTIEKLPPSDSQSALIQLARNLPTRKE
ncbi:isoprenoid synthase domain-containing protein [Gilbertella persicaria]|uniref:isoprenoid synthase domain-containing protein n=1 Tax=Gilbertella persicaria TaxID=101096 RepID=UPI00221FC368|nr:isoprenoid synthase domain-containing protein [Gilbertella persicaria]KAI8047095.1 isoprenoid synthase domain-containing protein [Gilbertella persicaria]